MRIPALGFFLLQSALKDAYRRAMASGFESYSAVWIALMPLTIVLSPVAQALGLKKGIVAQCDRCHSFKFIWSLRCPHCDFPGAGTIMNKQMARLARGDTVRVTRIQRVIVRLFIPLQIVLMFGFFGTVGNRPFESHTVLLSFQGSRAARQTATAMKDWVQAHPDADAWLASNGQSPKVPEKYRLHVEYDSNAGYLTVKAYGLRWDSAQDLPAILAESLKGLGTFETSPLDKRDASGPLFGTRTYLDNQIHWIQRD